MSADRPAPPAVVQARVTARWDAAVELIRADELPGCVIEREFARTFARITNESGT